MNTDEALIFCGKKSDHRIHDIRNFASSPYLSWVVELQVV